MGIKQLYNDNLRKLPNEYGDVSVKENSSDDSSDKISPDVSISHFTKLFAVENQFQKLNNDFKDKLSNL